MTETTRSFLAKARDVLERMDAAIDANPFDGIALELRRIERRLDRLEADVADQRGSISSGPDARFELTAGSTR